jgi:hypothetical protein
MQELDHTRASDAERDVAAERLQVAFAGGRIDADEFDQRMRSALTARTRVDLTALLADLPEEAPHAPAAAVTTALAAPVRWASRLRHR